MGSDKSFQVVLSDRAAEMLLQYARFMTQVNAQAAENLRVEIIKEAKSLQSLPDRDSWLSDPTLPLGKYRRMLICKRYLLIYQIKGDRVYIEYAVDCRQDYQWLL